MRIWGERGGGADPAPPVAWSLLWEACASKKSEQRAATGSCSIWHPRVAWPSAPQRSAPRVSLGAGPHGAPTGSGGCADALGTAGGAPTSVAETGNPREEWTFLESALSAAPEER